MGVPKALFSDYTLADSPLTTNASSVFWTTVTGSPRGVYACPKSGCAARTTIYSNPNGFYDDAIAADDQNVYFAQQDTASTLYGVYRCPVTGCTGAPFEVMPTVMSAAALALDDTTVYIQAARETAAGAVPELWACPK
jgi:hypothetical protein